MMNKIKIAVIALVALVGVATLAPAYVGASSASQIQTGVNSVDSGGNASLQTQIKRIVNTALFLLGSIAVVMIVLGGIRYTISNGESSQIKSAKDTIMYAVIGLVVSILAYAIVNFVVDQFVK
jgi:multisubunit Na+/H+ antiporter MnhB subunit